MFLSTSLMIKYQLSTTDFKLVLESIIWPPKMPTLLLDSLTLNHKFRILTELGNKIFGNNKSVLLFPMPIITNITNIPLFSLAPPVAQAFQDLDQLLVCLLLLLLLISITLKMLLSMLSTSNTTCDRLTHLLTHSH
jgi:hypothetical protein